MLIVRTATTDGMHRIVNVAVAGDDSVSASAAPAETDLAEMRSLVRGHLDLIGHDSGPALMEVSRIGKCLRIVSCRTGGDTAWDGVR
jgi:hypothetical protein